MKSGNSNSGKSGGILSKVQQVWGPGPIHNARLNGPAPDRLYMQPEYPRIPSAQNGKDLIAGKISLAGNHLDCPGEPGNIWARCPTDSDLFDYLHGFEWLHDIAARIEDLHKLSDQQGLREAYHGIDQLIGIWLDRNEKWSPDVWCPRLVAERLMHLCWQGDLVLKNGDALWRSRVLTSMARQARHLAQTAHKTSDGAEAFMTAMGLCLAGLCLPSCDIALERGQELMRREMRLQLRSDGGHISRNPSLQLEIVIRMQIIAASYIGRNKPLPGHVRLALSRAAAMVQFFRCADGGLSVFNGGYEDDSKAIISAAKAVQEDTHPIGFAQYSQYQRLNAARSLLIADVGSRDHGFNDTYDAGGKHFESAGSFHFSSGRTRIVGNCGNGDHLDGEWPKALRQAAAHSGLSFGGCAAGRLGLFTGETFHQRAEEVSGILLEVTRPFVSRGGQKQNYTHSGREQPHLNDQAGQIAAHVRRLYLAAGGDDFRGEDRLLGLPDKFAELWRLRFHLHPGVKASVARDGQSVILAMANQEGWRFRTNFKGVRLEKSVYCGEGDKPVTVEQIVIGPLDEAYHDNNQQEFHSIAVKWAFKRVDGIN